MNDLREMFYYVVRIPTALLAIFLVGMGILAPVMPDFGEVGEEPTPVATRLIIALVSLALGSFIFFPNHKFSSLKLYRLRLFAMAGIGIVFIWGGVSMLIEYRAGGKHVSMAGLAIFLLYNAIALPLSVWLRRKIPEA